MRPTWSVRALTLVGIGMALAGGCVREIRSEPDRVTVIVEVPAAASVKSPTIVSRIGVVEASGVGVNRDSFSITYHVKGIDRERRTARVEITCADGSKKEIDVTLGDPPKDTGCKTSAGKPINVGVE